MADDNRASQGPEGTQDAPAEEIGTDVPAEGQGAENGTEDSKDPDTFPRTYVEELRSQIKTNREKAQRSDFLLTEVRRLAIREATRGILTDPEALGTWDDAWQTEDGLPDHDQLRTAAEALAASKPWLSRPRGDVGQGQHGTAGAPMSLSALLRS